MSDLWVGVILGGVLSILVTVATIWYEDHIRSWRDKQHASINARRQTKELKAYYIIARLHKGKSDSTQYLIECSASVAHFGTLACTLLVMVFGFISLSIAAKEAEFVAVREIFKLDIILVLFMVIAFWASLVCSLLSIRRYSWLQTVRQRLEKFTEYEAELRRAFNIPDDQPIHPKAQRLGLL